PMKPVYISVKRPKDGTLPRSIRQTYGKNTHLGKGRRGSDRGRAGDRLVSASEVTLFSMLPCTALRQAEAVEVQAKHPSHSEGNPVRRCSARRPLTARDLFEYSKVLIRQL